MKKYLIIVSLSILGVGCSSLPVSQHIIERADDVSIRPSWASLTNPIYEENGKKYEVIRERGKSTIDKRWLYRINRKA